MGGFLYEGGFLYVSIIDNILKIRSFCKQFATINVGLKVY